jgi:hypothetical protein
MGAVLVVLLFLVTAFALWMETRLGHRLALAVVVVDAGLAVWSLVLVGSGPLSISMALGTLFGDIIVGANLVRPRVREYFFEPRRARSRSQNGARAMGYADGKRRR